MAGQCPHHIACPFPRRTICSSTVPAPSGARADNFPPRPSSPIMKIRPTPGTAANIRLRLSIVQGHRHNRKRWQHIATFRCPGWVAGGAAGALTATPPTEDNYPKETFIHHQAGIDGRGGSSYIDGVVLRDRDGGRESWQAAASATRGDRLYYLQNWRADTVLTMRAAGQVVDRLAYLKRLAYIHAVRAT